MIVTEWENWLRSKFSETSLGTIWERDLEYKLFPLKNIKYISKNMYCI